MKKTKNNKINTDAKLRLYVRRKSAPKSKAYAAPEPCVSQNTAPRRIVSDDSALRAIFDGMYQGYIN
jgi:hypothetical protein